MLSQRTQNFLILKNGDVCYDALMLNLNPGNVLDSMFYINDFPRVMGCDAAQLASQRIHTDRQ